MSEMMGMAVCGLMDPHDAAAAYPEEEGGAGSTEAEGAQNGWSQEFHLGHVSAEVLTVVRRSRREEIQSSDWMATERRGRRPGHPS